MTPRVLLVNPNRMKPPVTPIALDYLASALAARDIQVDVLDLCLFPDWRASVEERLRGASFDAIGVTLRNIDDTTFASREFFLPDFKIVTDCLRSWSTAPVILGGSGFSIMAEDILSFCGLDLGIVGDGEAALPQLVQCLIDGSSRHTVPGLVYREGRRFHRVPPAWMELDDTMASPRTAVDNRRYYAEGGMGSVETKRGCPSACIYCVDAPSKGRRQRCRAPARVVDEMQVLLDQGIDCLHFCDAEFNQPAAQAEEVCREIVARGLGDRVGWYAYASPAPFDSATASLYRRAGCRGINFGVDSADDAILQALGRSHSADHLRGTAAACHQEGLVFMYDLLLGGPGETRNSLRRTIEAVKRMSPDRVGAAMGVRVFPGTRLAGMVLDSGPLPSNPHLHGAVDGNDRLFRPVFYLSADLGDDPAGYLEGLIGGDRRFLFMRPSQSCEMNYNYNDNARLVEAIRRGHRGAFWDILRRIDGAGPA